MRHRVRRAERLLRQMLVGDGSLPTAELYLALLAMDSTIDAAARFPGEAAEENALAG
jgi:hypothetical protein